MALIGLFFGTDTGNTEDVAYQIQGTLGEDLVDAIEVIDLDLARFDDYQIMILGIPTWYDGQLQSDWEGLIGKLDGVDFTGKVVALFGLGDQYGYAEFFLDAIGVLARKVQQQGAVVIGQWPTAGYEFEESKALVDDNTFYGLGIDQDCQPELTEQRVQQWCALLRVQLGLDD